MKLKYLLPSLMLILVISGCQTFGGAGVVPAGIRTGVVKILKTSIRPSYYVPWRMMSHTNSVGSGAVIEGRRIITNAHVVADATLLQVQKENDPRKYKAEVEYVAHDCDLAILTVNDPSFFEGIKPLVINNTIPLLRSRVTTYGFPIGGNRISITEGVVSRIELILYEHTSKHSLLAIQTDAPLNPGNSGGPVIQKGKIIGIAFQGNERGNNLGYLIPSAIISRFLEDIEDKRYDGVPGLGIYWDNLENPAFRKSLGMTEDMSGVFIHNIFPGSSSTGHLREGDVILKIDGEKIADEGSISFEDGRIRFTHKINIRQIGDEVVLDILRARELLQVVVPLKPPEERIVWYNEYESLPRYYIFGGVIFQPLNREYLKSWKEWWNNADNLMLYYFMYNEEDNLQSHRKEFVIINQVLPDPVNTYISGIAYKVVDRINGLNITNLEDVIRAFENPVEGFHIIEVDGGYKPMLIKAEGLEEANARILDNYGILSDRRLNKKSGYGVK